MLSEQISSVRISMQRHNRLWTGSQTNIFELRGKKLNILLTGATGYIGSYTVHYLSRDTSNTIIPLCRRLPAHFRNWKSKFGVVECDVTQLQDLTEAVPEKIDVVIHLAASNNVDTEQMPEKALIVNGIGTRNMLEVARERGCKLFVYFSVVQVYGRYGKEAEGTITVDSPVACVDDYALTHYVGEVYCRMYALRYDLNIGVVRVSNVFGCPVHPKIDRWSLVPGNLCLSAYKDGEIRLKSSGKQRRDFVSLQYVSESVEHLMKEARSGFNVYNLASENTFSILEVAKMVQSRAGSLLKREVRLICETKYPLRPNQFLVRNNLLGALKREEVRRELSSEIEKTIKMLMEAR